MRIKRKKLSRKQKHEWDMLGDVTTGEVSDLATHAIHKIINDEIYSVAPWTTIKLLGKMH